MKKVIGKIVYGLFVACAMYYAVSVAAYSYANPHLTNMQVTLSVWRALTWDW